MTVTVIKNKQSIIRRFIQEGLIGTENEKVMPKIDPALPQQAAEPVQSVVAEPNLTQSSQDKSSQVAKDEIQSNQSSDKKSECKERLETAGSALHLAEYHLNKVVQMKGLLEGEDIELDKIGAAHKIITDTKKSLTEICQKLGK